MKSRIPDAGWLDAIEILGGHPAMDFVNTVHSRVEPAPRDYLETPAHLIAWCRYMGLVGGTETRRLARLPSAQGKKLLAEARALRETLYAVFDGHLHGHPAAAALARLNRELERLARRRTLVATADGFAWRYRIMPEHPHSLLAPLAFAAAELLRSPELARLKACPPPEGCGWLFLDRSRNASRTWCSMRTCGNLAKQRRHRARYGGNAP